MTTLFAIGYLAAINLITLSLYVVDKRSARFGHSGGRNRVPEIHLHLLSMLGGWPGAMVAIKSLRHKTRKRSFIAGFWTATAINIVGMLAVAHAVLK